MFFKRKSESVWAQEGEVATQAAAPAPKEKLGWFEKRARRRRRRIVFEEVLGWILVPAFERAVTRVTWGNARDMT